MGMNNTTPEPRVNKLGHVVTKHVRTQDPAVVPRIPIPPLAAVKTDRQVTIDSIMENIDIGVRMGKNAVPLLRQSLHRISHETLKVIAAGAEWDHDHNDGQRSVFMYTRINGGDQSILREDFSYMPVFDNNTMHSDMVDMIQGLHNIEYFKDKGDLDQLSGVDREIAEGILRVTEASEAHVPHRRNLKHDWAYTYSVLFIDNEDLVNLVVEFPEKVDKMVAFIGDRKSNDPGQMRDYLSNGTALRDGVL